MKKVLLTALALWLLLPGCAKQEPVLNAPVPVASYAEGRELMAAAETREDAEALAALYGVTTIVQPGGSIRDEDAVKKADELGITMMFTGVRHFKH